MFRSKTYMTFASIVIATMVLSACGADMPQDAIIQTAVAQTVAAQDTVEPAPTQPPAATLIPTQTPFQLETPTLPPLGSPVPQGNSPKFECAKASLQDESVVDGIILKPGELFTKTWYIQNTSPCVWDTSYKIVFWDGNIMGGGYYYNLPQVVAPGGTIPISLVLTAPTTDGTHRSEWKLQTSDGINFGVGMYSAAFYTEIAVSSAETPAYGITNLDLVVVREPAYGCQPANMVYTAYATFTTNGPYEFKYKWIQQDGNNSIAQSVKIDSATQKTFTRVWKLGRNAAQNSNRWFQIIVLEPVYKEYPPVKFDFYCP